MSGDPLRRDETIIALATAPGRGALAVIRISGPDAFHIAARHVRRWPKAPRAATHSALFDGREELDDAIVTTFPAPHSFTGEDVVELSTHGGFAASASVLSALIRSGATPALPGEFTRRALMNGKLDLLQAEGIGELINARSSAMRRAALHQVHGGLSRKLASLRDDILRLEALVAYDIDFPGEDDGPLDEGEISRGVSEIERSLGDLLSTASFGQVIRDGALVVIAGPPNAGKSSLFNAMLGSARAIVTEIPGTTRDALEAVIDTGEWPVRLVDTAGLRQAEDKIERLGIEVSESYITGADVVLACADSPEQLEATAAALAKLTNAPIVRVWTKADLRPGEPDGADESALSVSAERLTGIEDLFRRISAELGDSYGRHSGEELVVTTARQHESIARAADEIRRFNSARLDDIIPTSVAAVHLRAATEALEGLIGAVDVEDVLTKLFSAFCIGK